MITKIVLTSLFSGVIVFCVIFALSQPSHYQLGKRLYSSLVSRKRIVIYFLVFVLVFIPVIFSLPRGMFLSPIVLAIYLRELVVSIIVATIFSFAWKIISVPIEDRKIAFEKIMLSVIKLRSAVVLIRGGLYRLNPLVLILEARRLVNITGQEQLLRKKLEIDD